MVRKFLFEIFIHFTHRCPLFVETAIDEQQRSLHPGGFIADFHR
jgi:hypothetical protein